MAARSFNRAPRLAPALTLTLFPLLAEGASTLPRATWFVDTSPFSVIPLTSRAANITWNETGDLQAPTLVILNSLVTANRAFSSHDALCFV